MLERLVREITAGWASSKAARSSVEAPPSFLENPLLADLIGENSNVVVQVLDMQRFASVYVSPNAVDVSGFTPKELNERGVWQWMANLSLREAMFQLKNALLVGRVNRSMPPRTHFRSALLNGTIKTKLGAKKRIVSQNFTIDWNEHGEQRFQLFLWRDATHLLRDVVDDLVVRHQWTPPSGPPMVWCYNPEKAKFTEQDLFSAREREILVHLRQGLGSKAIAESLGISPLTVDNHRKNMLHRTQFRSTDALIEICTWLKLVDEPATVRTPRPR